MRGYPPKHIMLCFVFICFSGLGFLSLFLSRSLGFSYYTWLLPPAGLCVYHFGESVFHCLPWVLMWFQTLRDLALWS